MWGAGKRHGVGRCVLPDGSAQPFLKLAAGGGWAVEFNRKTGSPVAGESTMDKREAFDGVLFCEFRPGSTGPLERYLRHTWPKTTPPRESPFPWVFWRRNRSCGDASVC